MDPAAVARHRLEAMEARSNSFRRTATLRRRPGSGGANRRQPAWPLAAREQPRTRHRHANSLLQVARPRLRRRLQLAQSVEPPYTDPYVRWCGRGSAARLTPIPIPAIAAKIPSRLPPFTRYSDRRSSEDASCTRVHPARVAVRRKRDVSATVFQKATSARRFCAVLHCALNDFLSVLQMRRRGAASVVTLGVESNR